MSQQNSKYKRLEALFSENEAADPNPVMPSANGELEAMKARISELEADAAQQQRIDAGTHLHQTTAPISRSWQDSETQTERVAPPAGEHDSGRERGHATILNRIHRFFSAPSFPEDEDKTRRAGLLHVILIAQIYVLVLVLAGTLISLVTSGSKAGSDLVVMIIGLALIILWRFLMWRGHVGIASTGMLIFFTLSVTMILASGGTIRSVGVVYFPLTVVMATLLINRRAGLIAFILTSLIGIGLIQGEISGFLPEPENATSFASNAILVSGLGLTTFLLYLATRGTDDALTRARENEQAIRSLASSLELRVADRTHDLVLASEVGGTITGKISSLHDMLSEAAEMIRSRFDLYYTQVYLLDPSGRTLILRAGTGEVGRQLQERGHHLLIDSGSLNGRAVSERKPIIVADTSSSPNFLPNPLLPKTRSEMVVPLILGGRVLGVLDMQSEFPETLNSSNLPAFETLAAQLSVAIQNAMLFAQSEDARRQVEANVRQAKESGWHDFLNAIERGERIGYSFNQTEVLPLEAANGTKSMDALNVPIMVTGANVGAIQLIEEERNWTSAETEIVQATAAQLAQHIDNLRLLAQAESYRSEAEQAVRRLTREGWQDYSNTVQVESTGYAYDLDRVRPLKSNGDRASAGGTPIPLTVRDEVIGELAVDQAATSEESMEIIEAVARQLGAHIENVRLSEQNELRAAELEKLVTQLRELDRLKSSFLANMSHEFRTPLNSILGFADVMLEELDGPLTENMSNDLGLIQKNGQHLLHLINDVLDMAKIESGKMNLNPETFRVHEILEDVTSITSTLASEKKLGLVIEKDSDKKVEIFADRTRLRQVMINIVNNAIKFTEQGRILIHASRHDGHVVIKVKDTGIGIPQDLLEAVFQEFTQVDISSTRKSGGTGLGLPISRRLIEMHGGRIWAESPGLKGEGTTLNVELPLEAKITESIEKQEK